MKGRELKLLAIDTATEACSAALLVDNGIIHRYQIAPRQHAALILSMVDELLAEAGVHLNAMDALAFGRGPGAFTGVRIAAGIVQGLAYGADLPVVPVSTLAALAQGAAAGHADIISAIDARMGEIYWCTYRTGADGIVTATGAEQVTGPEQLQVEPHRMYFGAGTGWQTYASILAKQVGKQLAGYDGNRYPDAQQIIRIARTQYDNGNLVSAAEALPVYLRNKVTG